MSDELHISEMAEKFGVSLRTLRFYESRGLLSPTRIGVTRFFGAQDQARLELIIKGKRLGFTLSEISELITSACRSGPPDLRFSRTQIENQIATLSKRRDETDDSLRDLRHRLAREKT